MSLKSLLKHLQGTFTFQKKIFEILFGTGSHMTYVKELSQPGQYACKERLRVVGPKGAIGKSSCAGSIPKRDTG